MGARPRILSLIPSATEWVVRLGLEEHLVGCTHECEPGLDVPVVVEPSVHHDPADPAGVDAAVVAGAREGTALYRVDERAVADLSPTVVLTQQLCDVCAVSTGQIHRLAQTLPDLDVVSLDGVTLAGALQDGLRVGAATGCTERAEDLVAGLREQLAEVAGALVGAERRAVGFLEWTDPPWVGGHWVPDQITVAGGRAVAGGSGEPSVRAGWEAFVEAEVLVVGPCGYTLDEAVAAAPSIDGHLPAGAEVWAVDARHCWSQPGAGLVDGVAALAAVLHPERLGAPSPALARRVEVDAGA